ncbi:MAG TPA: hypothetical protein DIC36_10605 [Gammaproteobacteria bacterium]|nr:hypothetical protein [Gammaproteobacteria bacterium]
MKHWIQALVLIVPAFWATTGSAHESRPAYLEINETQAHVFDITWRRPALGEMVLSMQPVFPESCSTQGKVASYFSQGAHIQRWTIACQPVGLVGQNIAIEGLAQTITDVLVRVAFMDGLTQTQILRPNATAFRVKGTASKWEIVDDYFRLGVEHILGGIDHLLFVLALLIIVEGTRRLLATITAFTVAHSLTLAAATLGWVQVPQKPVEAVIALSIVFVAGEILHGRQGRAGITRRLPWVVAFTFGLLHGFGFAGALAEVGLPHKEIPLALLTFNVGVEAGQILFIIAVLGLLRVLKRVIKAEPRWAVPATAYGIGGMAAFWLIERVSGFY